MDRLIAMKIGGRSKVTNGTRLLPGVDGRTMWAKRMRDVAHLHLSDLGGPAEVSEAEKSIIRRIATLTVELERMEERFATDGEADAEALDLYSRTSGNLRRLLEAIGLRRRSRDITPSLSDIISARPTA